jgi:aldose 1-epimerase
VDVTGGPPDLAEDVARPRPLLDHLASDFRGGQRIGSRISQLSAPGGVGQVGVRGYDHNWVLRGAPGELHDVAIVRDPASGRVMRLRSTEPGVQVYTAGDLDADVIGKGGVPYVRYGGLALETQKFPCSPNFSHFPATELRPGQLYRHQMVFAFSNDAREGTL